jgi:hypothetical protein
VLDTCGVRTGGRDTLKAGRVGGRAGVVPVGLTRGIRLSGVVSRWRGVKFAADWYDTRRATLGVAMEDGRDGRKRASGIESSGEDGASSLC